MQWDILKLLWCFCLASVLQSLLPAHVCLICDLHVYYMIFLAAEENL